MEYVLATYKGGLEENYFLDLTKNKTYKGFLQMGSLFIEDDESKLKNNSHKDLLAHKNCYCIELNNNKYFDIKEL